MMTAGKDSNQLVLSVSDTQKHNPEHLRRSAVVLNKRMMFKKIILTIDKTHA